MTRDDFIALCEDKMRAVGIDPHALLAVRTPIQVVKDSTIAVAEGQFSEPRADNLVDSLRLLASRLPEVEEGARLLVAMSFDPVLVYVDRQIRAANEAALEMLGAASFGEFAGRPIAEFFDACDHHFVLDQLVVEADSPAGPKARIIGLIRLDGTSAVVQARVSSSVLGEKTVVQIVFRDFADRRHEPGLAYRAQYDELSELPCRSQFRARLIGALSRADRLKHHLAVMFVGLDHFESVNASLGQAAGDFVLHTLAERLKSCGRKSDAVARVGGDVFAHLCEGLKKEDDAALVAGRVLDAMSMPVDVEGRPVQLTASIGIAFREPGGVDLDTIWKHADVAMYAVKDHGRNGYRFYCPELGDASRRNAVRHAEIKRRLASLTPREQEVMELLILGTPTKRVADVLGASVRTIEKHRSRILEKVDADSLSDLVRMAMDIRR